MVANAGKPGCYMSSVHHSSDMKQPAITKDGFSYIFHIDVVSNRRLRQFCQWAIASTFLSTFA